MAMQRYRVESARSRWRHSYDHVGVPWEKTTTGPLPTSVTERASPSPRSTSFDENGNAGVVVIEIVNRA